LVLAALFLGWAANTLGSAQDWKMKYDDKSTEMASLKEDLEGQLGTAQTETKSERGAKDQYKNERDDSTASVDRLTADLQAQKDENAQLRSSVSDIQSTLQGIMQSKDDAVAASQSATEARHEAQTSADQAMRDRDAAQLAQSDAEGMLRSANGQIQDQMDTIAMLQGDLSTQETLLAVALEKTGLSVSELHAQPYIAATVMQATYDIQPGMVSLQVGTSDGVKRGFTFEISRGATYKGRVRVTQVHDNMCSALITDLVQGQTIAQGDKAQTNL